MGNNTSVKLLSAGSIFLVLITGVQLSEGRIFCWKFAFYCLRAVVYPQCGGYKGEQNCLRTVSYSVDS